MALRDQRQPPVPAPEVSRRLTAELPVVSEQALVLTGPRRAGKSVILHQLMERRGRAFYFNLEDTRFYGLTPEDYPNLLAILDVLAPGHTGIFIDEVQEAPEWERLVRSLLDRGRAVCITGSNASLLSRELGAKLTGRHRSFDVFPFDYGEYLAFTGQKPGAASFQDHLDAGGFPIFLHEREPQVLRELLRDIVHRDIAVRHRLREVRPVMTLALFLLANTGQPFSMQRLTKTLHIPTVAQTSRYLELLEDAYLLFPVDKLSSSFRERSVTPKKYYAVDNGLRRVNSPQLTPDLGHRLENAVYLALRARGESIAYASEKDRWECDFVTPTHAIQVCARLSDENAERELEGALKAAALTGERQPLILTLDQRDRVTRDGAAVEVRPVWEWLADSRHQAAPTKKPTRRRQR